MPFRRNDGKLQPRDRHGLRETRDIARSAAIQADASRGETGRGPPHAPVVSVVLDRVRVAELPNILLVHLRRVPNLALAHPHVLRALKLPARLKAAGAVAVEQTGWGCVHHSSREQSAQRGSRVESEGRRFEKLQVSRADLLARKVKDGVVVLVHP